MKDRPHLAFFMASLADGGIGKMRIHLSRELAHRGIQLDLLLGTPESPYLKALHPQVRVIDMGTSHSLTSVPRLVRYLRRERPDVLITERVRVNVAAIRARKLARVDTRVYAGVHTTMSQELGHLRASKQRSHGALMHRYYPQNDGLIAVSRGVAQDLQRSLALPEDKIRVVPNPVVFPELVTMAEAAIDHPWFSTSGSPVILGAGRLEPQKDFPTLIRAFAQVKKKRSCRLAILGKGNEAHRLRLLARELGVEEDLLLPGFVENPYAYMGRSRLFVLSSAWEGFGNVLVEALALGIPVVATDCPNGPREILQNGKYGPLVPVGDAHAMARAMEEVLERPPQSIFLKTAAEPFSVGRVAAEYLKALGFGATD